MLALVTGATGFIGRRLVQDLQATGIDVRALLRPGSLEPPPPGTRHIEGDLRDISALYEATRDCSWVFHLAAARPVRQGAAATPAVLRQVNAEGTGNLVRAALASKVQRFVFTSSAAVYGRALARHNIDEDSSLDLDSPYAESKAGSENALFSEPDLPFVNVRTTSIWGPGSVSFASLFQTVAANRFRLEGSGEGMHTLTHIDDLSAGLQLCATTPGIERQTYLITGDQAVPLKTLMSWIAEDLGAMPIKNRLPGIALRLLYSLDRFTWRNFQYRLPKADRLDFYLADRTFSNAKARRDLGFSPKIGARESVRATAESLRAAGLLPALRQPG